MNLCMHYGGFSPVFARCQVWSRLAVVGWPVEQVSCDWLVKLVASPVVRPVEQPSVGQVVRCAV